MGNLTWPDVAALAMAMGLGAILLAILQRAWSKADRKETKANQDEEIHASNQGKAIDQDVNAFNRMDARLTTLEADFKKLQSDHSSLMAEHAGLEKENEYLKRENERLTTDLREAKGNIKILETELLDLRNELEVIKTRNQIKDGVH